MIHLKHKSKLTFKQDKKKNLLILITINEIQNQKQNVINQVFK